jgi:hypothetical protein
MDQRQFVRKPTLEGLTCPSNPVQSLTRRTLRIRDYGDITPQCVEAKTLAMCTALLGATHGVTFVALVLLALNPTSGRIKRD